MGRALLFYVCLLFLPPKAKDMDASKGRGGERTGFVLTDQTTRSIHPGSVLWKVVMAVSPARIAECTQCAQMIYVQTSLAWKRFFSQ